MSREKLSYGPFFTSVYIFIVLCVLALGYLVFGKQIDKLLQADPIPMERTNTPQAGGNAGAEDLDKIVDGIHLETGLVYADGFDLVRGTCTACHSAKLVTQNRATKEGWAQMIRWMQSTQGLWELGANEPKIISYLATNYGPEEVGRRPNLDVDALEWYVLELDD